MPLLVSSILEEKQYQKYNSNKNLGINNGEGRTLSQEDVAYVNTTSPCTQV